ncbi:hypothetical protein SLS55_003156 [Diplodia seriata]|uniref:Rhodopsin domain-containing protein n=1 Tax=Diplodia seriata TaxID=420778 RepID=A0ABR3CPZ7_9PEZI
MSDHIGVASLAPNPAKVPETVFIAVLWAGFATATILSGLRFFLRFHVFRRFYLDDAFVLFAWIIALSITISWQILAKDMYLDNRVASGRQLPPVDFVPRVERFLKGSAAIVFLFYSTLWAIKLSFLLFFRRIYMNIEPLVDIAEHCSGTRDIEYQRNTLMSNCILDVATDIAITCIPISMLWKVRISPKRKVGLAAVFSVIVITIVFAIVRVAVISSLTVQPDMSWLYMWSNIEIFAALIVACLGSFRSLFRMQDSARRATPDVNTSTDKSSPPKWHLKRTLRNFFTATDSNGSSGQSTENDTLGRIISLYGTGNRSQKPQSDEESANFSARSIN